MHVLWTPSWYPSPEAPNNGSFFQEQLEMLERAGNDCGVIWIEPRSLGQSRHPLTLFPGEIPLVRAGVWLVPHGVLPLDRFLIARQAIEAGKLYEAEFGIPDVIHAHSVWPGIVVAQTLSKYWGIPYGLTEHRPSSLEAAKGSNRANAIQRAVEGASFYATVSHGMSRCLKEYYQVEDVTTVALPVRDAFFEAPVHAHFAVPFVFVHISNMDENKRTEFTLEVFARYHSVHPETKMLFVGGDAQRVNELESLAQKMGIADAVEFTGQVDRTEIIDVFNRADCMILVSALEAGGTVFAEATSLGIPSIASDTFGGSFMITSENGIVIGVDDGAALETAMLEIQNRYSADPGLNQRIRDYGKRRFSEATFAKAYLDLYEKVVSVPSAEKTADSKKLY